jgi:hypothetical protein
MATALHPLFLGQMASLQRILAEFSTLGIKTTTVFVSSAACHAPRATTAPAASQSSAPFATFAPLDQFLPPCALLGLMETPQASLLQPALDHAVQLLGISAQRAPLCPPFALLACTAQGLGQLSAPLGHIAQELRHLLYPATPPQTALRE